MKRADEIDFSSPDWFDQYVSYRQNHPIQTDTLIPLAQEMPGRLENRFNSLKHPFYLVLQQSGLIYGFPVEYPFQNSDHAYIAGLKPTRRAQFILLDLLLHAHLLETGPPGEEAYALAIAAAAERIRSYYQGLHQYGRQGEPELIESVLLQRLRYRKRYLDFRKSGLNSHLFWDIYFFLEYCRESEGAGFAPDVYFPQLVRRKKQHKRLTMALLTAAAHADRHIARQEKRLYRQFERSARLLDKKEKQTLKNLFDRGLSLEEIDFPDLDWLARRYLFDVTLLGIYADAAIDRRESAFLRSLLQRLDLTEDELLASEADLGSFLFQHGKRLHFYQAREVGLYLLARAAADNFSRLAHAAKMEYVETRDMAGTFGKILATRLQLSKRKELPDETEIRAAFDQLKDIPKFLPFFSFIFMPVPGITEVYILLAFSLEKLTDGQVSLLPSQVRKAMRKQREEEEE